MKTILIEKNPDLTFDSDSTATLRVNSLVLPDLKLNGTAILKYPVHLKSLSGSLDSLELSCRLTPEAMSKGVVLLGAYLDGDEMVVGLNGNMNFRENQDLCRVSFIERIIITSLEAVKDTQPLKAEIVSPTIPQKKTRGKGKK